MDPAGSADFGLGDVDVVTMERAARRLIDSIERGDVDVLWGASSSVVRDGFDKDVFITTLSEERRKLGPGDARRWMSVRFEEIPEGERLPAGHYLVYEFRARLQASGRACRETITLRRDAPNVWRLAGYLIRPVAADAPLP